MLIVQRHAALHIQKLIISFQYSGKYFILVLLQSLKKDVAPCHVGSEIHDATDVNKVF